MNGFDFKNSQAYFRDGFVPFGEANVSIASSPVLYGLSIYTVFSANWNEQQQKLYVFRMKEHYERLVNSAKIMDFDSFAKQWPYEKFKDTMLELLRRNSVKEDALVRVTVFIDGRVGEEEDFTTVMAKNILDYLLQALFAGIRTKRRTAARGTVGCFDQL